MHADDEAGHAGSEPSREALIVELERRQRELAEAQAIAHIGSWEYDGADGSLRWSDELFRLLGFEPGEIVPTSQTLLDRLNPDDRPMVDAAYAAMQTEGAPMDFDARLRQLGGEPTQWVRVRGVAIRDGDTMVRAAGTVQDITESKEAEQGLAFLSAMAAAANEARTLGDALVAADTIVRPFTQWPAVLVSAPDPAQGGALVHFDPGWREHSPEMLSLARKMAERAATQHTMIQEVGPGGTVLVAGAALVEERAACVVVSDSGAAEVPRPYELAIFGQMLALLSTVAQREAIDEALAAARDEALAASRAKSDFLATMSHEIRTPLNGVIGLTELLTRTELTPHQRRLAAGVDQAGRSLLALVNDILDLSKVEAGRLDLEEVDFDPVEAVDRAVSLLADAARAKGIALAVGRPVGVPGLVRGDPVRFGQVVTNLVSNAVKFTDTGRVDVRITGVEPHGVRVEVVDTGIGIEPDVQGRLFSAFSQADSSTTRRYGGTGLGLAISRRLVDAMSGSIGVQSAAGEGSTFWFQVPFQAPLGTHDELVSPMPPVVDPTPSPSGLGRVLVVEDNEVNQLVATGMLGHLGYEVTIAADGAQAVAAVASEPGAYVAVLMDCQMPVLDGFDATRAIRALDGPGASVPVIAMTASALTDERERCRAAGMDDFLPKPVEPAVLAATLERWTSGAAQDTGAADRLQYLLDDGFDPAMVRNVVARFGTTSAETLTGLVASALTGEAHDTAEWAHRLRGAADNLGLRALAALCQEIEVAARAGDLPDSRRLEQVRASLAAGVAELDRAGAWL